MIIKKRIFSIRLEPEDIDRLKDLSDLGRTSIGEQVRISIKRYLDESLMGVKRQSEFE